MRFSLARRCLWMVVLIAGLPATVARAASSEPGHGERWFQLADVVFQNLGVEQGLPNHSVTAFAEDSSGFLWIGTQGGVARWDGYRFRNYRPEPDRLGSLPSGFVNRVLAGSDGRIWVGTGGGLASYQSESDRFKVWPGGPGGLRSPAIQALANDGADGLWVGTEGGLDHLDPATGAVRSIELSAAADAAPASEPIYSLLTRRQGQLWVGAKSGLHRRAADGRFERVPLRVAGNTLVSAVYSMYEDRAGRVWLGSGRGVFVVDPGANEARLAQAAEQIINGIVEAAPGELWFAVDGGGVLVIETGTGQSRWLRHDPARPHSIPHDAVATVYRDRAGLVWVGTRGGLGVRVQDRGALRTVFGGVRSEGLSEGDVMSLLPMADGRVWAGLYTRGVDILDPAGLRVGRLPADPRRPASALPADHIYSMVRAGPRGEVFMATNEGLYRADPAGTGVERVTISRERPNAAAVGLYGQPDALWVGSFGRGLWRLDPGSGKVVGHYAEDRFTDSRVAVIAPAGEQALWIGTLNGLNHLDLASGSVEQILPDAKDPQSLAANFVASLLTDRRGRLWVGTLGGGINVLVGRDGQGRPRFHRLGPAQGLPSVNAEKLLADGQGRIWAACDDGIAVIDPDSFAVRVLRRAEGVHFPGYWLGAGTVTPAGELLFGGRGGFTVVRPDRLTRWDYRPPVVITELRVGGKPQPSSAFNSSAPPALLIHPEANSLAVEFAALDYSAPERNQYAYRLDGYDPDWVETDWSRRSAAYTNLPPGDYTLRLRGSNRDGIWNEAERRLAIQVLPAWWQTWWFRLTAALATLLLLVVIEQSRTAWLRHRQRQLEAQVAERTAELTEAHRQLEEIAYIDALTHLPNRRMLNRHLQHQLAQARRRGERFAFLLLDLDRFKQINDNHGHDAGDALLVEATLRFQSAIRESDFLARMGGDEFALLLAPHYDDPGIDTVCRRIVDAFVAPVLFQGQSMQTSPSIGVARFPEHGETADALFKAADLALYAAKRAGRNTWRWHGRDDGGPSRT